MEGGVQAFRAEERDADKLAREDARAAARKETLDEKTADRLSKQYDFTGDMDALLADCEGNWGCVRKKLKNMDQTTVEGASSDKDTRTAEHLAAQYGVDLNSVVWAKFNGACGEDWNCVRAALRDAARVDKKDK